MATGSILGVNILTNGAFADITIEGLSTGGTYDFGLGPGNHPATGSPKVVFHVVSQGFTNGVLGTRTRTIYGTYWVRKPFSVSGNEFTAQESMTGTDVTVRIALSESIYDSDNNTGGTGGHSGVAPTVTIASGFYTAGGTPNLPTSSFAVTNNSTLAYPRVIGNISRPIAYEKVGTTWRVAVAVFHGHAMQGQQVDCVKFTAADASGHSTSATVNAATVDTTYGDAVPVIEHLADLNTSGFTQGDIGTLHYIAYPWIGNGASVLDTAGTTSGSIPGTGSAAAPSPYYGPISFVCDPAGTYCRSYVVVDAANGNDGTGAVGLGVPESTAPPAPYATISGAYNALRTYNNSNYGRNNCGGSTIYLKDNAGEVNNFAWLGGTPTIGTRPACVLTITRFPGHSRDNVVVSSSSGGKNAGELVSLVGVKLTATNAVGVFDPSTATSYMLFDQCEFNVSVIPTIYRIGVWHMTRCRILNFTQGWTNYGAVNASPGLCRGNTIVDSCTSLGANSAYTVLGNLKTSPLAHSIGAALTGAAPNSQNIVVAYNRITAGNTNAAILRGGENVNPHGSAFVQNVLENCNNLSPAVQIAADRSNTHANNILLVHNVVVGQRCSLAYNEYGAAGYDRLNWFIKNNVADDFNIKSDTFLGVNSSGTRTFNAGTVTVTVTQSGHQYLNGDLLYTTSVVPAAYKTDGAVISNVTANTFQYSFASASDPGPITSITVAPHPARIRNWPVVYGVNSTGNVWAETAGIGAATDFMPNFTGLKCQPPTVFSEPPKSLPNTITYLKFVNRRSFNGTTTGTGGGDYHLQPDSPAVGNTIDWVLPYGLDGKPRKPNGAAGAYEYSDSAGLMLRRRRMK